MYFFGFQTTKPRFHFSDVVELSKSTALRFFLGILLNYYTVAIVSLIIS